MESQITPNFIRDSSWAVLGEALADLEKQCRALGLSSALAQAARVRRAITDQNSQFSIERLGRDLIEVHTRFVDELHARLIYILDAPHAAYFTDSQFSPVAKACFPEANHDMEEAGKCLAFERPTACAFHLMRVTEYALHEMAKVVGIQQDRPNWEPIIRKIDMELKSKYEDRIFKGSADLLANMSSHLQAVKVAWRNRVMHVEKKHTMEEAREIYDATRGLMRYLAENLPERS
ncbi:MAG: hypothetical protein WD733_24885 [Bryobacterales bacterium]